MKGVVNPPALVSSDDTFRPVQIIESATGITGDKTIDFIISDELTGRRRLGKGIAASTI
jgi:hypothetical protein